MTKNKTIRLIRWIGLVLLLLPACTTNLKFNTQKTADPRFSGLRTIGVNGVVLMNEKIVDLKDDLGRWTVRSKDAENERMDVLIRKSLVVQLKKFSDYEVIDLNDLRKFQYALQRLRPVSGEKIGTVDLIIDVRAVYYAQLQEGTKQEVMTFKHEKSVSRDKKWIKVQDTSRQQVVTVPYSDSRVDIICYVEVIKTQNGDASVIKSFNVSLTNNTEPKSSIAAMINEMGVVIAGRILKDVSRYSVVTTREIDNGSDDDVLTLMKEAQLNKAASKLEGILSDAKEKEAADVYNLGVCYEAFGDPALALQMYREAHGLDKDNELYMKAIGELE